MKKIKSILIAIAIFIAIKVVFSISGYRAVNSVKNPLNASEHATSLIEATSQQPKPTEGFERLILDGGLQIDVPLQWEPLPEELATAIRTTANAVMSSEGLNSGPDRSRLLAAYTSRPTTTYAAVRVKEIVPTSISPAELLAATDAEVAAVAQELAHIMSVPMAKQNQDMQPGATTIRELISGHPALVFRYRRLGEEDGLVAVEQIKIMTPTREISVTLSYREAESALWKPVIDNIRQSIKIPS